MVQIYHSCFHLLKPSLLWENLVRIINSSVVSFLVLKTIWPLISSDKFFCQHALLKMKGSSFSKSLLKFSFFLAKPAKIGKISVLVTAKFWSKLSQKKNVWRWLTKLVKIPCWWLANFKLLRIFSLSRDALPKLVKFPCWWLPILGQSFLKFPFCLAMRLSKLVKFPCDLPILGSTGGQWQQRWRLLFVQITNYTTNAMYKESYYPIYNASNDLLFGQILLAKFFSSSKPGSWMWPSSSSLTIPHLCLFMLSCFLLVYYISLDLTSH